MNANWESILDQFLTGQGSRADVESLRLRISLGAEEREEVEESLRLVDELAAAGDTIVAPPGAAERLSIRLQQYIAREGSHLPLPRWEWDGAAYRPDPMLLRPTQSIDDEEIATALIEGRSTTVSIPHPAATDAPTESSHQLEEFQKIVETLSDPAAMPSLPPGAEDRLLESLRGHMASEVEAIDPSVARRILRQLKSCPLPSLFSENLPDVLAATTEHDPESPSSENPDNKR